MQIANNILKHHHLPTLSEKPGMAMESFKEQKFSEWNEIREILVKKDFRSISDDEFWRFLNNFARLFKEHDCTDTTFIVEVLNLAWRSYIFLSIYPVWTNMNPHRKVNIGFKNLFFTPYKKACDLEEYQVDAATTFAMCGQLGPLELMLRFGATPIYRKVEKREQIVCAVTIESLFSRHFNAEEIKPLLEQFNETSRRRLFFVFSCLEAVLLCNPISISEREEQIASWRLYLNAIPEPFVTGKEIMHKLKRLFQGIVEDKEIESVVQKYTKYFPEGCEGPGPRSLKHLSRFQVRETLRTSSFALRLPQAIDSLPVPRLIKEYISLREKDVDLLLRDLIPPRKILVNFLEE